MLTSSMFVMAGSSSHLSNTSISQRMVQSNSCLESMSQGAQRAKIPPKRAKGKMCPVIARQLEKFTLATGIWRKCHRILLLWPLRPLKLVSSGSGSYKNLTELPAMWVMCGIIFGWASVEWQASKSPQLLSSHTYTPIMVGHYLLPWPFWHCVLQVDFAGILPGFEQLAAKASSVHSRVSRG